jgi:hypothetical protein
MSKTGVGDIRVVEPKGFEADVVLEVDHPGVAERCIV